MITDRRAALQAIGGGVVSTATLGAAPAQAAMATDLVAPGASRLRDLLARLEKAPKRRDFKTVPMVLNQPDQWDHAAIEELKAYKAVPKQAWDNAALGGPWLNVMRNTLNTQIWSFRHPDFLAVSMTHGSANFALYDQATWDKYQIVKLAGDKFPTNTLIVEAKAGAADPKDYEDPAGAYSPGDNTIPALMRRGVVFLSCHNAIWEQAAKLHGAGNNPDNLSVEQVAAELTNHLLPGVVLMPGALATMLEFQQSGFFYASSA